MKQSETRRYRWSPVQDSRKNKIRGLWKRNGVFYAQLSIFDEEKGLRVPKRIRLEASTVSQAQQELNRLKIDRDTSRVATKATPRFATYFSARLDAKNRGLAFNTVAGRRSMSKHLLAFFGDLKLTDIQRSHVRKYQDKRLEKARPSTINLETDLLGLILADAVEDRILIENPVTKKSRLNVTRKEKPLLSPEEVESIAKVCLKKFPVAGQSYHDLVLLLAYSGARIGEAVRLRWDTAVNWDHRTLIIGADFKTKSGKKRAVDFNPPLQSLLRDMTTRRVPDSNYLFPSPRRKEKPGGDANISGTSVAFKSIKKLTPDGFTPHSLRHYFASRAVMSGIDFMTIAKWLGHQDGGVLIGKVYGHLTESHTAAQAQKMNFGPSILPDHQRVARNE